MRWSLFEMTTHEGQAALSEAAQAEVIAGIQETLGVDPDRKLGTRDKEALDFLYAEFRRHMHQVKERASPLGDRAGRTKEEAYAMRARGTFGGAKKLRLDGDAPAPAADPKLRFSIDENRARASASLERARAGRMGKR